MNFEIEHVEEWMSAGKAKAPLLSPCKGEIEAHFGGKPCYCCYVPGGWLCKSGLFKRRHGAQQSVIRSSLSSTMSNDFTRVTGTFLLLSYLSLTVNKGARWRTLQCFNVYYVLLWWILVFCLFLSLLVTHGSLSGLSQSTEAANLIIHHHTLSAFYFYSIQYIWHEDSKEKNTFHTEKQKVSESTYWHTQPHGYQPKATMNI